MEATLELYGLEAPEPFRGDCPSCGAEVLAVDVDGREVVLEVSEVMPEHDCPLCAQVRARGHRRSGCVRCADTGRLGEPLPLRGVALDADGRAFPYLRGMIDLAETGCGVHAFHVCLPREV